MIFKYFDKYVDLGSNYILVEKELYDVVIPIDKYEFIRIIEGYVFHYYLINGVTSICLNKGHAGKTLLNIGPYLESNVSSILVKNIDFDFIKQFITYGRHKNRTQFKSITLFNKSFNVDRDDTFNFLDDV